MSTFPSLEHRESLQQKFKAGGYSWSALTHPERSQYHAYDYGWRRVVLDDAKRVSPIDQEGRWFDPYLIGQAEAMWRRAHPEPKQPERAAMTPPPGLSDEERKLWWSQADEVERLRRIAWAGPDRLPNGERTPEALAWATAAGDFARHWQERWQQSTRRIFGPPENDVDLDELARELGVRVREESGQTPEAAE
jgi:hypothetical protein